MRQSDATETRQDPEKVSHTPRDKAFSPAPVEELSRGLLEWLAQAGGMVAVRSRLLGCEVLFVGDQVEIGADESRPVYRVAELVELLRAEATPETLRQIHAAKVILAGEVIPRRK